MARAPRWEEEPDDALVARIQSDPQEVVRRAALAALLERWSDRVLGWARRFTRERESALDLAQDCMLAIIGALPRYQPAGRFGAWVFTIVHNRCRNHVRPRALRRDPEVEADELVSTTGSAEEEFESRESLRRLLATGDDPGRARCRRD